MPSPSIYIVNPRESHPFYYSTEVLEAWGIGRVPGIADLTIPTLAAFVPEDWRVALCDERAADVDFNYDCDIVAITGKISQRKRMFEVAAEFRRRGKVVVIGGPHASLDPEDVRPHADVLVIGEIEDIAATIFADLKAGRGLPEYRGGKPDLKSSPVPRWDLYAYSRGMSGQIQTSRGCPFECEFCDVIQYLGRKQRWKEPDQVIRELELLYSLGYRDVLLADDNFTVVRKRARALLEALEHWNASHASGRVRFTTQMSIDVARDPDLLSLAVRAGLYLGFIGVETPNEESLIETKKRQNLRIDLKEELCKVAAAGILPMCGMIVGFDHDGPDIFSRQLHFIESIPVPSIMLGMLGAPHATPLYERLAREGRLLERDRIDGDHSISTNIVPLNMSMSELKKGTKWLLNKIYAPRAWISRLRHFAEIAPIGEQTPGRSIFTYTETLLARRLATLGDEERRLLQVLQSIAQNRPDLMPHLGYSLLYYCQTRHMLATFGIWDLAEGELDAPLAA